jgi:TM2 domain-containing membrane protein YozV
VPAATLLDPELMSSGGEDKDRRTAAALALFLGGFGIHQFYLGNTRAGIFMLLFCWTGIPSVMAIGQGIQYLKMTDEAFAQLMNAMRRDQQLRGSIR